MARRDVIAVGASAGRVAAPRRMPAGLPAAARPDEPAPPAAAGAAGASA
jgi:hypothetical protein